MAITTLEVATRVADLIGRAPAGGPFNEVSIGTVEPVRDDSVGSDFRIDLVTEEAFVIRVTPLSATR